MLSHVFSPQYLIWLLPLALLLALNIFPRGRAVWWVFSVLAVAILALSGWIWPYHHHELTQLQSSLVTLAVTRSACLAALAALLNVCFFARYGLVPGRADREAAGGAGRAGLNESDLRCLQGRFAGPPRRGLAA